MSIVTAYRVYTYEFTEPDGSLLIVNGRTPLAAYRNACRMYRQLKKVYRFKFKQLTWRIKN